MIVWKWLLVQTQQSSRIRLNPGLFVFISNMILGKLFNLTQPHFSHLSNVDNIRNYFIHCCRDLMRRMNVKELGMECMNIQF